MGINETPRAERVHISIFGRRNAGKSSLINAITGQNIAVVSPVKGTTTDPVYKSMELLPIGPVVFVDTAGLDDEGELGELRKSKSIDVLNKTDIAIVVVDATVGLTQLEADIAAKVRAKKLPAIIVVNKADLHINDDDMRALISELSNSPFFSSSPILVSAAEKKGIQELKQAIIAAAPKDNSEKSLLSGLVDDGDVVVLVTPIDSGAPKGRMILPQQQTIREVLDKNAICIVTKETELEETLKKLVAPPKIVITDSQAFDKVAALTPKNIPLTSFSIIFARYKGDLEELVRGATQIKKLQDGDKVLIAEACTHHQQQDDIGTVKIPRWLKNISGKELELCYTNGGHFPEDLSQYALIIHCGACMINNKAMLSRIETAKQQGVPIVNYGVLIGYVTDILERAIMPFPEVSEIWNEQKNS